MEIKKTGKERWKYSGQMAWALRRYAEKEVDRIEWAIIRSGENYLDIARSFKAEFWSNNILLYRLEGKAVLMDRTVTLLISERIEY